MAIHPLVAQLRFTRSEFVRCLKDISPEDGIRRIMPMNSISWIVGHLANQEQAYWVVFAQGRTLVPGLAELVGTGKPASTPPLDEMWAAWHTVTQAADGYLDGLETRTLETHFIDRDKPRRESIGTMLLRNIYHYWYHTGEAHAIRDMLGHVALPQFVGDMTQGAYRPES
jgi:uncharacterized damage-inducible protein DinB